LRATPSVRRQKTMNPQESVQQPHEENPQPDLAELISLIDSPILPERIEAINVLGEIGDQKALQALRLHLNVVNQELFSLVTAVGKLKRRLQVK
jgi:hypothetical protein